MKDANCRERTGPRWQYRVVLRIATWLAACAALGGGPSRLAAAEAPSLYDQSISILLTRRFSVQGVSYLLVDARTGRVLGARWDDPARPVPMGSLVKPFTALAYGEAHGFRYPEYVCRGAIDGCWLPRGHGRIGIEQAIAHSCNAYFRRLAADVDPEHAARVARKFGISSGLDGAGRPDLIGLGSDWQVAPIEMARAYCELVTHAHDAGASGLVRGMALSAEAGTGRAVAAAFRGGPRAMPRVLTKTGTAPCVHRRKAPGDGYAVALWPAESPRYALLVGVHGVPGSGAAAVVGKMLRAVLEGE